ncbi:hypothetical protein BDZ89DRAFT_90322 [Hymenopellis radicata]|nr:hypothetical protein BDZ89DRAFT_90322 [Hymenopellis radicata]
MHLTVPILSLTIFSAFLSVSARIGFQPPPNRDVVPYLNNAARMSQGLPLLKPKRLFSKKSTSTPSGFPNFWHVTENTVQTGALGCYDSAGNPLGFISPGGPLTLPPTTKTTTPDRRSTYTYPSWDFPTPSTPDGIFPIYISGQTTYTLQGLGSCSGGLDLKPTSSDHVPIRISANYNPKGYVPNCVSGVASLKVEPWIWSIDSSTGELKAQWINSDGSTTPNYLYYNSAMQYIWLVGDYEAARSFIGDSEPISIYFGTLADWDGYFFPQV